MRKINGVKRQELKLEYQVNLWSSVVIKLFNQYFHMRLISGIIFDFILLNFLFFLSISWHSQIYSIMTDDVLIQFISLVVGIIFLNNWLGLYANVNHRSLSEINIIFIILILLSLAMFYIFFNYIKINESDKSEFSITLFSSVVIILVNRLYVLRRVNKGYLRQRILVYGSGSRAISVGNKLESKDSNVDLVGYYTGLKETVNKEINSKFLSSRKTLTDHVRELKVDEIVVALSERRGGSMPLRELLECKLSGVRVVDMATHFENKLGKISGDYVSVGSLIFGDGFRQGVFRRMSKRIFDVVFSLSLLILALPILMISSLIILFESGFPIIYSQERVGLNGEIFSIYKLRSMQNDAEEKGKPVWALLKDDRITRFGRIIRKFRIDELPQLFSVLNGKMSLVGPRPERHYFVEKLIQELPFYEVRQSVKPGITGWAQVRYHYGSTVEDSAEKLQYDLYYVKNNSIVLDFIVLFKTIGVVLAGKGAH
jgi:sugar transferase (PEP-CTERM system associated)